jgi:hypothetical protein
MSASNNAAIAATNNPKRNFRSGESSVVRSLSSNLKYPYKRTISAPAGNLNRHIGFSWFDFIKIGFSEIGFN